MIIAVGFLALLVMVIGLAAVITLIILAYRKHSREFVEVPRKLPESQYARDAEKLIEQIREALGTSSISAEQRSAVEAQVSQVPRNLALALQRLHRIRKVKKIAKRSPDTQNLDAILDDVREMERRVQDELSRMHETLLSVPVSLLKIDVARNGRSIERIVEDLSDMNNRLGDVAETYDDLREDDIRRSSAARNLGT